MRVAVLLLTCAIASFSSFTFSAAAKSPPDLKRAWKLYYDCDSLDITPLIQDGTQSDKQRGEWYEIKALTELFGEAPSATNDAAKAAQLAPNNQHVQATYALLLAKTADPAGMNLKLALTTISKVLKVEPQNGRNHAIYALCRLHQGRNKEAMREFAEAIKLSPGDFDVNNLAGEFYQDMLDEESAKACYDRMVKYSPGARAHFMRSTFRRRHDDAKGALEDLTASLNIAPNRQCWYYLRGSLLFEMLQYENAIKDFNTAEKMGWGFEVWHSRSKCYAALKQFDKAEKDLANTLKAMTKGKKPDTYDHNELVKRDRYLELWVLRANYAEQAGRVADALKYNELILRNRSDSLRARLQRAHCLVKLGRAKEALADFNDLIKIHPDIASLYTERSEVLAKLGRVAEAQADKKRAEKMMKEIGM